MSDPIWPAAAGEGQEIGAAVLALTPDVVAAQVEVAAEPGPEPVSEEHKALAERFAARLKFFGAQQGDHVKRWKRNRTYVNDGADSRADDGEGGLVRVNLVASVVNTIQPNVYAKAPEVSVQPEERITPSEYAGLKGFARTLELVLNRYAVRGAHLKMRGKEAVRSALTSTTGWVKVIYQKDKRSDPLVRNRINDAQDNILKIEQLLRETKDEGQCDQYRAKMAELRQQIQALESQVEVVVSEGIVIDNVAPEHIRILDASVRTIDEYTQSSAIAHGVYMTVGAYKAAFGGKEPPKKARRFNADAQDEGGDAPTEHDTGGRVGMDTDDELVLVWEIWSKDDLTVYTLCDGASEFCRAPYQPESLGQQWYPLFPLQLWRVNGYLYARALVDNLIELADEYNTRRTVAAEHRRKNGPVRLFNKAAGITDEEIATINGRGAGTDVIGITTDPGQPLANQLGSLPEIPYNPQMYDTSDILRDIEMVSGAQDASRGGVNKAKTATEAEIMSMGMQSRTGEQLDSIEEWLTSILTYCAQLLLLNMTEAQIKAKFGEEAVWPELSKQDLFEQVMVQIRAGSTAKPNKMRERDQWLQFLPQMQEAIARIAELRQAGQDDMAEALIKVLDETLRRFDERMSIREFIPGGDEEGEEGGQPNLQQILKKAEAKVLEMKQAVEAELAERQKAVEQSEAEAERQGTALQVERIQFLADKEIAAARQDYEARARKLDAREAANDVIAKVTGLLDKHQAEVQAAMPDVSLDQVVDQVDALMAPALDLIDPPEAMQERLPFV
jgi:hypothetical protein